MNNYRLKVLKLSNFKNHDSLTLDFENLNEIFGANSTGKSAVLEAIQFMLTGNRYDVDKIKLGEESCCVEGYFVSDDEVPLSIKTELKKKSNNRTQLDCTVNIDGIKTSNPRSFLNKMISCGTFNPREVLNKKTRMDNLLSLVPLKVAREDLSEFEVYLNAFKDVNWNDNAFKILSTILKNLHEARLNLYQRKDLLSKAYKKNKESLSRELSEFSDQTKITSLDKVPNFEECNDKLVALSAEKGKTSEALNEIVKKKAQALLEIEDVEQFIESKTETLKGIKDNIKRMQSQVREIEHLIEIKEETAKEERLKLKNLVKDLQKEADKMESIKTKLNNAEKMVSISRHGDSLKKRQFDNDREKKISDKATYEWKDADIFIKEEYPRVRSRVLSPLLDKVPSIEFDDNKMLFENKSVDELSESETVLLAVKLMSLNEKSNLICINEAECLDKSSIKELEQSVDDKTVLLIRVAENALGDKWHSREIKNEILAVDRRH